MINAKPRKEVFFFRGIQFNYQRRLIVISQKTVFLTKKEADVLLLLCTKMPNTVTYDELKEHAWNGTYASSLSIAQIIRKIRVKINDKHKEIIITHPNLGYRLSHDDNPDLVGLSEAKKNNLWQRMSKLIQIYLMKL